MTVVIGLVGIGVAAVLVGVMLRMLKRSRITDFDLEVVKLTAGLEAQATALGQSLTPKLREMVRAIDTFGRALTGLSDD